MEEIQDLSKYFSSLIDTIPLSVYFNRDGDVVNSIKAKRTLSSHEDKENGLSAKAKAKRLKLDATAHMKVSDVASAYYSNKEDDKKRKALKKKLQKKIKELRQSRGATETAAVATNNGRDDGTRPTISKNAESPKKQADNDKNTPKILNAEGNLVFSKFDLTSHGDSPNGTPTKPEKKKNLKALFKMSMKATNKLKKLEQTNSEAAHRIKEKEIWRNALQKAEGNKVLNDPKLLERKIKRKMKEKVKSAKTWKERNESVEHRKNKRQEKREININKRKEAKKGKKMKLLKKKGRIL